MRVDLGVALVGSALLAGCRPGARSEPSPPGDERSISSGAFVRAESRVAEAGRPPWPRASNFPGRLDRIADALDPVRRQELNGAASVAAPLRRAVVVPREAIQRLGDETVVFLEGGREGEGRAILERRRVVVNEQRSGGLLPVVQGLGVGERVATHGAVFLLGT